MHISSSTEDAATCTQADDLEGWCTAVMISGTIHTSNRGHHLWMLQRVLVAPALAQEVRRCRVVRLPRRALPQRNGAAAVLGGSVVQQHVLCCGQAADVGHPLGDWRGTLISSY